MAVRAILLSGNQQMFEFILAVFLLEVTPGPNMAYLATLRLRGAAPPDCMRHSGVALGLSVHAGVTVFGAGTLIQHYPWLYETLRWTGVAYLLFLAWEGWWPGKENSPVRADLLSTAGPLFLRGFLSNVLNPKSILFFVSVVPTFVRSTSGDPSFRPDDDIRYLYVGRDRGPCGYCDVSGGAAPLARGRTAPAAGPRIRRSLAPWPSGC
jgi:hypothetical protein